MRGLGTEIPDSLEGRLSARTVGILLTFEKRGFASFTVNPSDPDDTEVLRELREVCDHVGYALFNENQEYVLFSGETTN